MAKMTDNKKMILIGASGLLLGAAALGGVWWSKGLVDEQQGEIEKMRTEIADAQKKIDKIPSLERDVIVLRECVREYVKILPEEGELNNFVRNANQFMAQSGVQFKKLLPGQNQGLKIEN